MEYARNFYWTLKGTYKLLSKENTKYFRGAKNKPFKKFPIKFWKPISMFQEVNNKFYEHPGKFQKVLSKLWKVISELGKLNGKFHDAI